MKLHVPSQLKKIALEARCPIYIVGGYIRNSLLGFTSSDIDICGALLPEELGVSASVVPVNRRLGTALIGGCYEYTPLRQESYGEGGEHSPKSVSFGASVEEDARRRDFTAGSVYYDIAADEFIDPFCGLKDIETRTLRCADPDFTFADDGLRLMRLARIAAETDFTIEDETFDAARRNAEKLSDISPERKRQELDKILSADLKYNKLEAHYRGVVLLKELGLWKYIIPEVADMGGVKQNPLYHKYDCLDHSLMAVRYAHPSVRLAALLHDVGKPVCLKKDGNTYMHAVVGAQMVREILGANGLRYPNKTIDRISELVRYHMYDLGGQTKVNKVKVFLARHNKLMPDLVRLIEADGMATGMKTEFGEHRFTVIFNELIKSGAPLNISCLAVNGNDVVKAGFKGEQIKKILEELWRICVIDPSQNTRDSLKEKITRFKRKYKV